MGRKKTHEEYEAELFELEIDSYPLEQYKGSDTPILHACSNGHETLRAPGNVIRFKSCIICAGTNKCDHAGYLEKLKAKGITYFPIEKYVNTDLSIKHQCSKGHIWSSAPKHILEGRGCMKCSPKIGFYSESFFRNNPEACELPGLLYCVVLVNKKTDKRTCVKIGIAKGTSNKDVLKRAGHFDGYEVRVQKVVKGRLEDIYYLEQYLHELWSDFKYTSEWKFGGHSELFQIEKLQEILKTVPAEV